jgi:hypothetical protein
MSTRWLLWLGVVACAHHPAVRGGDAGATTDATIDADAAIDADGSDRTAPSRWFDLSGWNLTLPIDANGGTGGTGGIEFPAVTIKPAQLTSGFLDDYFYANRAGTLVFTAPSTGAVTTPGSGSDHTRSELRELYAGAGADTNHDWTSAIGGSLSAACTVRAVSVDSDEATIGQIHGQTDAFVLLMVRPMKGDVALSLYATPGGSSTRTSITTVGAGQPIGYTLAYSGNTLTVTVNGTTQSFAIDPSWAGTPVYFKLGAYHAAPNTGNPPDDATQVAFTSFGVTH